MCAGVFISETAPEAYSAWLGSTPLGATPIVSIVIPLWGYLVEPYL